MKFRAFLKGHAEEEELDQQFLRLHRELFQDYDCSQCRNCCKMLNGVIPVYEVERDAAYLNMTEKAFIDTYLERDAFGANYQARHTPCDFLESDGSCRLGEWKPNGCKTFPYTDQPERLDSLYSVLTAVEVCPVAFEIWERLKQEYGFQERGRYDDK